MLERVTFFLAVVGYAGLTVTAVLGASRRLPVRLWRAAALVIVVHVMLVWAVRYEWSFAEATRNGYAGFVMFHGALWLIIVSIFARERVARVLVWTAFVVVSVGALGAVFRYEIVAPYRFPVILLATLGTLGLARAYVQARARRTGARAVASS